jgi:hypothetical protein
VLTIDNRRLYRTLNKPFPYVQAVFSMEMDDSAFFL